MRKLLFILFCGAICIFGFFAFKSLNTPPKPQALPVKETRLPAFKEEKTITVLAARQLLPTGTFIQPRFFRKVRVPASSDEAINGFTSLDQLDGAITAEAVAPKQVLERAHLVMPDEAGFMALAIRTGHRGVSIPIWREGTSTAIYRPGDAVDLMLVATFPDRNEFEAYQEVNGKRTPVLLKDITTTLLTQNARILSVDDSKTAKLDDQSKSSFSTQIPMVIEIQDADAEKVALAAGIGKIMLFMRGSNADELSGSQKHTTAEQLFPKFKSLGPTRGTTILRGTLKDVEGYPLQQNEKQKEETNEPDQGQKND